jgi:hypothetical protein
MLLDVGQSPNQKVFGDGRDVVFALRQELIAISLGAIHEIYGNKTQRRIHY